MRELEKASLDNSATLQSALGQLYYVNLPRAALREGAVAEVGLRRRALIPVNGRTYALTLGSAPFSLTVNNGLHGRAGAHYVIEHDGERYEYLLDGFGWDSEIQVAEGLHLVALEDGEYEPVMLFINHSCEPNVGFQGNTALVAMVDVPAGAELTTDYALFDGTPYAAPLTCTCGAAVCRGTITGDDWRRPDLQARFAGWFSSYLAARISSGA